MLAQERMYRIGIAFPQRANATTPSDCTFPAEALCVSLGWFGGAERKFAACGDIKSRYTAMSGQYLLSGYPLIYVMRTWPTSPAESQKPVT